MKKFEFKLAGLLKHRKFSEDEALKAVGLAQGVLESEKQAKRDVLKDLERGLLEREKLGSRPTDPQAFAIQDKFILGLKLRVKQSENRILRAERELEKTLRAYLNARRRTRMIELLRERAYDEYRIQKRRAEQKELDDQVGLRFSQQRSDSIDR